jgi:hypothetical protein
MINASGEGERQAMWKDMRLNKCGIAGERSLII